MTTTPLVRTSTDPFPSDSAAGPLVLLLGGTGKTGRRVAGLLTAEGVGVRIGSRSGTPPFAWEDPSTWPALLDGVQAAYLAYAPDLAAPGGVEAVDAFSREALRRGVQRLVLLSGRGEPAAQEAEQAVRDRAERGGGTCTVVRSSWFMQGFSEDLLLGPVLERTLALPVGPVPEPFVDAGDVAAVAAAALTDPRHGGELYEVTGPELLTFAQAAGEIARASGRPLDFVQLDQPTYDAALAGSGVPDEVVAVMRHLFSEVLDGRNARLADGVRRALGRPPRSFRDFAREAAATGVWQ